jgi:SHS2 domain-containing protein
LAAQPPFEVIDHTADVGIVARGATLAEAFANAATGMFSLMVELEEVAEREERRISVEAADLEGLLIAWLSELLFILDVEELVFSRFEVDRISATRLEGRAFGERLDRQRHPRGTAVKAVTRHMLRVGEADYGYEARVIFDI